MLWYRLCAEAEMTSNHLFHYQYFRLLYIQYTTHYATITLYHPLCVVVFQSARSRCTSVSSAGRCWPPVQAWPAISAVTPGRSHSPVTSVPRDSGRKRHLDDTSFLIVSYCLPVFVLSYFTRQLRSLFDNSRAYSDEKCVVNII